MTFNAATIGTDVANIVAVNLHNVEDSSLPRILRAIDAQRKGKRLLRPTLRNLRGFVIAEMGRRVAEDVIALTKGA